MMHFANTVVLLMGCVLLGVLIFMIVTFSKEGEKRAAIRTILLLPIVFVLFYVPFSGDEISNIFSVIVLSVFIVFILYLLWPQRFFTQQKEAIPIRRLDERTIMFSRNELRPGSERFEDYYAQFPDHLKADERFRQQPGLLSPESNFYHPLAYAAAEASFYTVEALHSRVENDPKKEMANLEGFDLSIFIRAWLLKLGAVSVGFTEMKDYHWYTTGGRGDRYGTPIVASHTKGIAFTVEMDREMVTGGPRSSIIMESAQQYLNGGIIAVQLAQFLRNLGFEARAHIDGNYQVICPLVARDANLGEIGRMGLLMTPELGPRVRLGVVTTSAPLLINTRKYDASMEQFCMVCKKCATACPSSAISDKAPENSDQLRRWQINSEKCFTYWCSVGTDCGRCMSVCPYSHPNNFMHNSVRFLIRHFPNARWWAVKLDDYFYGRRPAPGHLPGWMQ